MKDLNQIGALVATAGAKENSAVSEIRAMNHPQNKYGAAISLLKSSTVHRAASVLNLFVFRDDLS